MSITILREWVLTTRCSLSSSSTSVPVSWFRAMESRWFAILFGCRRRSARRPNSTVARERARDQATERQSAASVGRFRRDEACEEDMMEGFVNKYGYILIVKTSTSYASSHSCASTHLQLAICVCVGRWRSGYERRPRQDGINNTLLTLVILVPFRLE